MTQNNTEPGRLYTKFISILKAIQYFGYSVVVAFTVIFVVGSGFLQARTFAIAIPLIFTLLYAVIGCLIVYVSIQSLIAIVDLLSRIELNTRSRWERSKGSFSLFPFLLRKNKSGFRGWGGWQRVRKQKSCDKLLPNWAKRFVKLQLKAAQISEM